MLEVQVETKGPHRHEPTQSADRIPSIVGLEPSFELQACREIPPGAVRQLRNLLTDLKKTPEAVVIPDPKRDGFYDLNYHGRTYYIHVYPPRRRVTLLAVW